MTIANGFPQTTEAKIQAHSDLLVRSGKYSRAEANAIAEFGRMVARDAIQALRETHDIEPKGKCRCP